MINIESRIRRLERGLDKLEKLNKLTDLYLKLEKTRLLSILVEFENLPPGDLRRILAETSALSRYLNSRLPAGSTGEDTLLLLAALLLVAPVPIVTEVTGLGLIGAWALAKKLRGEPVSLETVKQALSHGVEKLKDKKA